MAALPLRTSMFVRHESEFMSSSVMSHTLVLRRPYAGRWVTERGCGMNGLARLTHVLKWIAVSVAAVGAVLVAGLVLVAVVAQGAGTDTGNRGSNAGQAVGVPTA